MKAAPAKIIAIGTNQSNQWGSPENIIRKTIQNLQQNNIKIIQMSDIFNTKPYGVKNQNNFLNAVITVKTAKSPITTLRVLKKIEKIAKRKYFRKWGPRTLDLDLVAYNNYCKFNKKNVRRLQWQFNRYQNVNEFNLCLPHYQVHKRDFVLKPLYQIKPYWHHPLIRLTTAQMIKKLNMKKR